MHDVRRSSGKIWYCEREQIGQTELVSLCPGHLLGTAVFIEFTEKEIFCFETSALQGRWNSHIEERAKFQFRIEKVLVLLLDISFEFQPLNDQWTKIVDRRIEIDQLFDDLNQKLKAFSEQTVETITLKELFDDRIQLILERKTNDVRTGRNDGRGNEQSSRCHWRCFEYEPSAVW